jgi:DNA-binding transcriptional ArsR family regulator
MKTHKILVRKSRFSLVLLIFITLIFLLNFSSIIVNSSNNKAGFVSVTEPEKSLKTSDTLVWIKGYNVDVAVIPPQGSQITKVSDDHADIQLDNGNKTVDFSTVTEFFSDIGFSKSITGLDDFNMDIAFAGSITTASLVSSDFVSYSVDWGNGDSVSGDDIPTSDLSYTYRKEGNYQIRIQIVDKDGITYQYTKNESYKLSTAQFVTLWVDENKETVAASSAGLGSVALLGFALTETGKYKLLALLPLLIPMYTRIQKEDVLDQFVRGEIFGFIKTNPGVHYNEIMRELDMKNGTLSYHLYMLEKTGMIKSRREGVRFRAFYPTGMKFPQNERYRLTELQTKIIKNIRENPGINQKWIAKKLGEKHQTISYNVKVLQQAGLITLRKKGRKTVCYINDETFLQET